MSVILSLDTLSAIVTGNPDIMFYAMTFASSLVVGIVLGFIIWLIYLLTPLLCIGWD